MDERKAVKVSAALIWEGERFLVCQRPEGKKRGLLWEFVGGKAEPGETGKKPSSGSAGRSSGSPCSRSGSSWK